METDLLDLPLPLLGSVLAKLQSVADVASAACSCKVLRSACQEAPLALRVEPHESGGDITLSQRVSRVLPLTSALKGICETHPNVVALDLRGCAVSDVDLHLLQRIWSLRSLNLSGCQKL